jgi:hypothetical protein
MFYLLFFVFAATTALAQTNIDSLIDNAPGLNKYPQASVVYLLDRRTVTLEANGTDRTHREFLCKILDERARDSYGDQSVRFDAEQDTVIIEIARTRRADKSWIDPEKDAFTLTSAPEVQQASAYSQLKQRNVSFPGLEVGAAIYFVYRIEPKPGSKPPQKSEAGGSILFGMTEPIRERYFAIDAAANRPIRYEMQNGTLEPVVTKKGERTLYEWTARDCPQIVMEPNTVGLADLVPRLMWTAFPDWQALGVYMSEYFWQKVDTCQAALDGFAKLASPDLKGKPALMNAATWLLWNIRDVHLSLGSVGYEPNTADRVWQNRYGDPRDKAVLLAALLRGYGFGPLPVLVTRSSSPFSDLPVLEQFNHIILAVPVGVDTMWLDPMAEYYQPGTLPYADTYGKGCLLLAGTPLLMTVPAGAVEMRGARTDLRTTLSETGDLSGTVTCAPLGDRAADARARFKDQKAQEQDIYKQRTASRIGQGTQVTDFFVSDVADLSQAVIIRLGFQSPGFAVKQQDLMIAEVPVNPFDFGTTGFYPALPQVRYPIQLPPHGRWTTEFNMAVPKGYAATFSPAPIIVDNPYVRLEIASKCELESITWTQTVEIKADKVPIADYAVVREAFQTAALPKNRLVILEAKKGIK